jgi:hypothetical protein
MHTPPIRIPVVARHALLGFVFAVAAGASVAADAVKGIEQALVAAQQDKRGITIYVSGQTIGGAVTRVEPGQWVELKNQTHGKIIVRIDRIDAIAAP